MKYRLNITISAESEDADTLQSALITAAHAFDKLYGIATITHLGIDGRNLDRVIVTNTNAEENIT